MKPVNTELTEGEKERLREMASLFPENDRFKKCYIWKSPLETLLLSKFNTPKDNMKRLFIVQKEYQFLKTIFTEKKMVNSLHLTSLEIYYSAMNYIFPVCEDMQDSQRFFFQTLGEFRRFHGKKLGDLWSFKKTNRRITPILKITKSLEFV